MGVYNSTIQVVVSALAFWLAHSFLHVCLFVCFADLLMALTGGSFRQCKNLWVGLHSPSSQLFTLRNHMYVCVCVSTSGVKPEKAAKTFIWAASDPDLHTTGRYYIPSRFVNFINNKAIEICSKRSSRTLSSNLFWTIQKKRSEEQPQELQQRGGPETVGA